MDIDLITCPKCLHSVSNTAGICAYCGATISKEEPIPRIDDIMPGEETQSLDPVPPPLPGESPPVAAISENRTDVQTVTEEKTMLPHFPFSEPVPPRDLMLRLRASEIETVIIKDSTPQVGLKETKADAEPEKSSLFTGVENLETSGIKKPSNFEMAESADSSVVEVENDIVQEKPLTANGDTIIELTDEAKPEASEEEILLTLEAEVRPVLKNSKQKMSVAVETDSKEVHAETTAGADLATASVNILNAAEETQPDAGENQKRTGNGAMGEILRLEKAAQNMEAALKKQLSAVAQAQIMRKEKPIQTKSESSKRPKAALSKDWAMKNQIEAEADLKTTAGTKTAASLSKKKETLHKIVQGMKANPRTMGLLKKYEGRSIGINYDNTAEIKKARLIGANDEFFSIFVEAHGLRYSYPLNTILAIIEGKDGVGGGVTWQEKKFNAVIKLYPLMP